MPFWMDFSRYQACHSYIFHEGGVTVASQGTFRSIEFTPDWFTGREIEPPGGCALLAVALLVCGRGRISGLLTPSAAPGFLQGEDRAAV